MNDQKNTILAIVLSAIVLIGWQYFFGDAADGAAAARGAAQAAAGPAGAAAPGGAEPARRQRRRAAPARPGRRDDAGRTEEPRGGAGRSAAHPDRDAAVKGSIALKGGRLDDLSLSQYRETVDPNSPAIVLLSPSGKPASVLCRVRLGRGRRHQCEGAGAGYGVAARGGRIAHARNGRSRSSMTMARV